MLLCKYLQRNCFYSTHISRFNFYDLLLCLALWIIHHLTEKIFAYSFQTFLVYKWLISLKAFKNYFNIWFCSYKFENDNVFWRNARGLSWRYWKLVFYIKVLTLVLPETCPILHSSYRIPSLLLLFFKISNNYKKHLCDWRKGSNEKWNTS